MAHATRGSKHKHALALNRLGIHQRLQGSTHTMGPQTCRCWIVREGMGMHATAVASALCSWSLQIAAPINNQMDAFKQTGPIIKYADTKSPNNCLRSLHGLDTVHCRASPPAML
jgi:hypothetical protein